MQARFLFGPAGSGKTFRCLAEIRQTLAREPEGLPLLLIAPKQSTYQLERRLLAEGSIQGYTRLHILSFERLAHYVFRRVGQSPPNLLSEEGRIMVLRGLLSRRRSSLQLFRASARLTGFARQLSVILREFQNEQAAPHNLRELAARLEGNPTLSAKLLDFALVLEDYQRWLEERGLSDADGLVPAATRLCAGPGTSLLPIGGIWVDGFIELGAAELELLAALLPQCETATLTFCLDKPALGKISWLSTWSTPQQTFERCYKRLSELSGVEIINEVLDSDLSADAVTGAAPRFQTAPELQALESSFHNAGPVSNLHGRGDSLQKRIRLVCCPNPALEVREAARTILRHVRAGGRFREIAVLVRCLEHYSGEIQRSFSRYEIPFFLDQRESVSHHPLSQLTRNALRTIAFQWQTQDWFATLKTGLLDASEFEIDRLETEALARGWKGSLWLEPIAIKDADPATNQWLKEIHGRLLPPFHKLSLALRGNQQRTSGPELAAALREFWETLRVEQKLEDWSSLLAPKAQDDFAPAVHSSVWTQMCSLLENLELGFPNERLSLREWLPIIEAGLAGLTVGLVPPALDQVLVGAVDRSRDPEIKTAIVLGLNEGMFPAAREPAALLTESEREALAGKGMGLPSGAKPRLSRERYLFYLACTRPAERLVLSWSLNDSAGTPINPSPLLSHVEQVFPPIQIEHLHEAVEHLDCEHPLELLGAALKIDANLNASKALGCQAAGSSIRKGCAVTVADGNSDASLSPLSPLQGERKPVGAWSELLELPRLRSPLDRLRPLRLLSQPEALSPQAADKLYGQTLVTSVSKMEQFAACPFKFFVHSGLRAEERKQFELDLREQGSFQHDVLARFHQELKAQKKRWHDLSPGEARERIYRLGSQFLSEYRDGLLQDTDESRFLGTVLISSLQDFVETVVGWMRTQYQFEPFEVELPFGKEQNLPPWTISLGRGRQLALQGRIDRIDLLPAPDSKAALCVVVDYKSSQKKLDEVLLANGLQLQLLAYLRVLQRAGEPLQLFGVERLIPAGVFYVNLRGKYERETNRALALQGAEEARRLAYRHSGRFSEEALPFLDSRANSIRGDQFNYRRTDNGKLYKNSAEALPQGEFENLLESVEQHLQRMGREVFEGAMAISPFKKGGATACLQCSYSSICRVDPYTQTYRVLALPGAVDR